MTGRQTGRRRAAAAMVAMAAATGGGCLGGGDRGDAPPRPLSARERAQQLRDTPIVVRVYEYGFAPADVVVKAGHSVAWKAVGEELHTIVPRSEAGRRVFLRAEQEGQYTHRFPRPGVYPYACAIHPRMRGRVRVVRELLRHGG